MTGALRNTLAFGVLVAVISRLIALVVGWSPAISAARPTRPSWR